MAMKNSPPSWSLDKILLLGVLNFKETVNYFYGKVILNKSSA